LLVASVSKFLVRATWLLVVKSVGLTLTFFGGLVMSVVVFASGLFALANASKVGDPVQFIGYGIGDLIAVSIFAFGGLLFLGTGLWMLAPKHRIGRFGKRLVVNRLFRRGRGKNENDGPDIPTMGLILKLPMRL
jgi:hypothetical protein